MTDPYDFWDRQLEALGDRDPLEVLRSTPDAVDRLVGAHPPGRFARRPAPGTWSPAEVLGHLVDVEWVFGFRCRTIAFDEAPAFPAIDQERWVKGQAWREAEPGALARLLRSVRDANLGFWESRGPEELERTGLHQGAGVELSLALMRRIQAGHDLVHLEQIERRLG